MALVPRGTAKSGSAWTPATRTTGIELADAVDRVKAITGRIDLVHCNDWRDEFGSGADRHANFDSGTIDPQALLDVVRAAGAPVVCETPEPGLADDIAWLLARIDGSPAAASSRPTGA